MNDIVERLRAGFSSEVTLSRYIELEAADEIERLVKEVKQLEDHWDDIAHERNDLKAEIERLRERLKDEIWPLTPPSA